MSRTSQLPVVLAGGSGQVGTVLARHFQAKGDSVVVLGRNGAHAAWRIVHWDGATLGPWVGALEGPDTVINLAGRSVNCRYNPAHPPRLWMNAGTATIYRRALDRPMDESTGDIDIIQPSAPSWWNFSMEVATRWEPAFFQSQNPSTRKIALHSAMVMSPDRGGIFDVFLSLVRFGLGGASGSGEQYISWIHEADFVNAIEFLIAREEITGCVNLSAPNPFPNSQFMHAICEARGIGLGLPAHQWKHN